MINFTIPFVPIVPIEELKEDYFTWKRHPVGAGPYKIKNDYLNDKLVLEKINNNSHGPKTIEYHTKRMSIEYDLLLDTVDEVSSELKYKKNICKYPDSIMAMRFFRSSIFGKNLNLRKAIHHAINRDHAAQDSTVLKPAYEMSIKPYSIKNNKVNPYNPALAKEYANKLPKSFFEKKIRVGVYSINNEFSTLIKKQIEFISKDLKALGLTFEFEPNQEKFPTKEVMAKFDIKLSSKVMDLADPSISYGAMSESSPYKDEIPDSDGKFEKAYQNAIHADTYEKRLQMIQKISDVIEKDALIVPLFERYVLFRTNPKTIKSLGDQPKPLFLDLSLVEMN